MVNKNKTVGRTTQYEEEDYELEEARRYEEAENSRQEFAESWGMR